MCIFVWLVRLDAILVKYVLLTIKRANGCNIKNTKIVQKKNFENRTASGPGINTAFFTTILSSDVTFTDKICKIFSQHEDSIILDGRRQ